MSNPYTALLSSDHQTAIFQTLPLLSLFTIITVLIDLASFVLLIFIFVASVFYMDCFINKLIPKQKLLMILPARSEQLIQAVYSYAFRYIAILIVSVAPCYYLLSTIETNASPLHENISLYVVIVCTTALICSLNIAIYFTLKKRALLKLVQITALCLALCTGFTITHLLESLTVPYPAQLLFIFCITSITCFALYKYSLIKYYNFNLLV